MFEKEKITKDSIMKIIAAIIVSSIFLLAISILTDDNDSRKQIASGEGTESELTRILSQIKGVSDVDILVEYGKDDSVTGVIVTARGAEDPVIKNNILKGVSTLFDIPLSSVMVFEKKQEEKIE